MTQEANAQEVQVFKILSVENLNKEIKSIIETRLNKVWVKGEISNFKAHSSGHFYFILKDSNSQIRAVMYKWQNSKLKFTPKEGDEVLVKGRVTLYEPRGEYQITCDTIEPVGAGALQKQFEDLKKKLFDEGLFHSSRKRHLPKFPAQIVVVTSPTGAAIKDILQILRRRAPSVPVTVVPTVVQGAQAHEHIIEALKKAYLIPAADVIILGRGGGSIEDLWAFNHEALARAIARSPIPIISAVGHEIDFTIADFVADLRAPTPSAAAELVVQNTADVINKINGLVRLLAFALRKNMKQLSHAIESFNRRLIDPRRRLQDLVMKSDDLFTRLENSVYRRLQDFKNHLVVAAKGLKPGVQKHFLVTRNKLENKMQLLDSLSPLKVVNRGYSIVKAKNSILKSLKNVEIGSTIGVYLSDGSLIAEVKEKSEK